MLANISTLTDVQIQQLIPSLTIKYLSSPESDLYSRLHKYNDVNLFLKYFHHEWNPTKTDSTDFFSSNTSDRINIFFTQFTTGNVDFFDGNVKDFAWLFYILFLKSDVPSNDLMGFIQKLEPFYIKSFFMNCDVFTSSLLEFLDENGLVEIVNISPYHAREVRKYCQISGAKICVLACEILGDFVEWFLANEKPFIVQYVKSNPEIIKNCIKDERYALVVAKLIISTNLDGVVMSSSVKTCVLLCINSLDGLRLHYKDLKFTNFDLYLITLFHCQTYRKVSELIYSTVGYDNLVDNDTIQGLHLFFEELLPLEELKKKFTQLLQSNPMDTSYIVTSIHHLHHCGVKKSVHDWILDMILSFSNDTKDIHHIIKMISQMTPSENNSIEKSIFKAIPTMNVKQKVLTFYYLIKCGFVELETHLSNVSLIELMQFLESDSTFTPCLCLLVDQFPHVFTHAKSHSKQGTPDFVQNVDFLSELQKKPQETTLIWKKAFQNAPILISIQTINFFKNAKYKTNDIYKNLLLLFKWKSEFYHLEIFLIVLDHFMTGSRKYIQNIVQDAAKATFFSLTQDSAVLQVLLELCLQEDIQEELILDFVHQKFLSNPYLARMVHLQTYNLALIPKTVKIESMHICIDFLPEIINHPNRDKRIFGFVLLSHLLIKYPTPRYMELTQYILGRREFEVNSPEWIGSFARYQKYYPFECLKYMDEIKVTMNFEMNDCMTKIISNLDGIYQ
jgi:hypothetical protein